jgi:hypothetical protein
MNRRALWQTRCGLWPTSTERSLVLPASRQWRLLQALHGGRGVQLSRLFAGASPAVISAIRWSHPVVLTVLDPRPLRGAAAILATRFGGTGLIVAETLAAGPAMAASCGFGGRYGSSRNKKGTGSSSSQHRSDHPPLPAAGYPDGLGRSRHLQATLGRSASVGADGGRATKRSILLPCGLRRSPMGQMSEACEQAGCRS